MQIQRLGEQPEPQAMIEAIEATGAHCVRIRTGGRTHLILSRNGLLCCGGLETDGQAAAVEVGPDGGILRAMAVGARKLRYNGQTLLDADEPQDWSSDRSS